MCHTTSEQSGVFSCNQLGEYNANKTKASMRLAWLPGTCGVGREVLREAQGARQQSLRTLRTGSADSKALRPPVEEDSVRIHQGASTVPAVPGRRQNDRGKRCTSYNPAGGRRHAREQKLNGVMYPMPLSHPRRKW